MRDETRLARILLRLGQEMPPSVEVEMPLSGSALPTSKPTIVRAESDVPLKGITEADLPWYTPLELPPILPGRLIVYRDGKRLRGGPEDRAAGLVEHVIYKEGRWHCLTASGAMVAVSQIRGVTELNANGDFVAGWSVQDCGLDGKKSKRRQLRDLSTKEQQRLCRAFGLSPDVFRAFASGTWPKSVWKEIWEGKCS